MKAFVIRPRGRVGAQQPQCPSTVVAENSLQNFSHGCQFPHTFFLCDKVKDAQINNIITTWVNTALSSMLLLVFCKERITDGLHLPTKEKNLPSLSVHRSRRYFCILTELRKKSKIYFKCNDQMCSSSLQFLRVYKCEWVQKKCCASHFHLLRGTN